MARYLGQNDSSDDDFSDNLQLAERLRINRDKSNFRKKNFLDDQSSSSSSLEMQSDTLKDNSARTYSAYNKKRQNGDKSVEFFANPKRTCLSNRYLKSPDNQNKKKSRTERYHNPDFPCTSDSTSEHIFADKTYEDHLHNLAEEENPVFNSKQVSKRKFLSCLNERPNEDPASAQSKLPPYPKQHNELSKQTKNKYSTPNSPKHFLWREPQNNLGEHSRSTVNGTKAVSFVAPQRPDLSQDSQSVSDGSIVHYVDSASDEDSRSIFKNGSLKGGRQSPELSQSTKKVIGRKFKKVLDSDLDSDDDDEDWPTNKSRPHLIFSSSDSEAESDKKSVSKPLAVPESSDPYLFPVSDASRNGFESGITRNHQPLCYSRDNSVAGPSSSPISYSKSPRSFRNRKQIRTNAVSEIASNNFHSNNVGRRGRSRVNVGERYTRRSGSPHPRTLPNSHSRLIRSEVSKVAKGRSLTGSQARRANLNLATTNPDIFDAEDSSEVEFFTANSYSDTETSAESFGGLTISSTIRSPESNGIICEHSINIGSSEDEISVVFSSRPSNGEIERQVIRSAEPRRALGRRRQRGSWRHRHDPVQEVVSLSPDPVEQVRQVEDDERFARILQAQFDAEVDPDYSPSPQPCSPTRPMAYSPYDVVSPVNLSLRHSDSDLRDDDDASWMRVQDPFPTVPPFHPDWRSLRLNRVPHRHTPPNFIGNIFYNNRRLDRTRRRRPNSINHLLEVGVFNSLDDILYSDDSFETFLGIADLNGDVPRGLQKSEINRLPTRQYIAANNNAGSSNELPHKRAGLNKECQVCLSDYENGDTLRILPCFHEFHTPCIDPWLKINHTCPVCRVVVDLEG
ncbi:uncharacterized protein [Parasteatoda tepidariorum]|nr:uncharacterized protein LOC107451554 [Parasteatoda tepidariorum]XP_015923179.1 uncharacterized protein LOC107451554 [Parasteatoda tepidariorum]XP_015923180.1 uncharacterized protein LOC107451554 [Parasteatoda tepidariorum]XP_042903780.1 uncharacterized protein LOC107451554 [Parasteatoda tepidariorum]XP_042903783.1 uncharacterized protein LOC107451554 [Parasteatoda tepidariorum]